MKTLLFPLLVTAVLMGCNDAPEMDVIFNSEQKAVNERPKVAIDPAQLCSDISVMGEDGKLVQGKRLCARPDNDCKTVGETGCYMSNQSLYGLDPKHHKPENIKAGVTVGGVVGTLVPKDKLCRQDGDTLCVATDDYRAAKTADIKAKVLSGQKVGSHDGEFQPDLPDQTSVLAAAKTGGRDGAIGACANASQTNCLLAASQSAATRASLTPEQIKKGETIGGLLGQFETAATTCNRNGEKNCLIKGSFVSLDTAALTPNNLEKDYDLLTIRGQVAKRPGTCSTDGATGCVATGQIAAIDANLLGAGKIRRGIKIGGVTGDYPSATHRLTGANAGVTDLSQGGFRTALSQGAAFEYWDATGARHTATGSADLVAGNILKTKSIFAISGALDKAPEPCSGENGIDCLATTTHPAINKNLVSPGMLRSGIAIAGVTGTYPSAATPLDGKAGRTDLSFPANLRGTGKRVFFDKTGKVYAIDATADLEPNNILSGKTVLGQGGSAAGSPADCSAHNGTGCLATGSFPSYKAALITAGNVKKGEPIAIPGSTVTGSYPSAATPFVSAQGGMKKLTSANFNSSLRSTTAFEFWDSAGVRHSHQGDANFVAGNLLNTITVFGLKGDMRNQPSACSGTLVTECVTSAARPSYDATVLTANKIKKNFKIGAVTGTYPSASAPFKDASSVADLTGGNIHSRLRSATDFEYWDATGKRHVAKGDIDLANLNNLRKDVTILGQKGTQPEAVADCGGELQPSCVVKSPYKTLDVNKIDRRNIKANVNVLGVTGSYPSAGNTLPHDTAATNLSAGNWNTLLASGGSFEFWNAAGVRQFASGSFDLDGTNIKQGTTIYGVGGGMQVSSGNCNSTGQTGCTATGGFPSYDKNALTAGVLKKNVSVLSVTGNYPSSSFPMARGGETAAELAGNFRAAMRSADQFIFWDASGNRVVLSGDGDIQANNIRQGVSIFGIAGNLNPSPPIDPWNVRYGVTYTDSSGSQKTGKMKANCRSMTDSDSTQHWPHANQVSFNRSIDDYNGGRNRMPNQNPFVQDRYKCNGEAFLDVSHNTASGGQMACGTSHNGTNTTCIYKDRISALYWLQNNGSRKNHADAVTECKNSTAGGFTDWRLPTQKEALMGYVHGIRKLELQHGGKFRTSSVTWTNTVSAGNVNKAFGVEMVQGLSGADLKTRADYAFVHCVRH